MTQTPALLLDLDGTLAETAHDLHAAMNHVLRAHDLAPIAVDTVRHMVGGGARMILQRGFAAHNITPDDAMLNAATDRFMSYYEQHIDTQTQLFDGVAHLLARAKAARIKLAVITNKRETLAAKLLFRLGIHQHIDLLIGGDTLATRKPHPLPITHAIEKLRAAPAVMIGDSGADVEAAQAAGIAAICVSFGYRRAPDETQAATRIIDHFSELPRALADLYPDAFATLLA